MTPGPSDVHVETRVADIWEGRVVTALGRLAVHPATLFAVLWAINAIKFPYGNVIHDARLYAFQVQNQVSGGAFSQDLFLRFGSQDQFTPFSRLAAPLVAAFGVDWTFFVLYLISNALLLLAMQRLVRALIDDAVVSTAALVCLAVSPLPYGGIGVFHVVEPFFTPRLLSCAIALLALERALRARYLVGLVLAAAATLIHPLMGFGAVLIVAATWALEVLTVRVALVVAVVLASAAIVALAYRPLGRALFGTMDEEWLAIVRKAASYNFPGWWNTADWINVSMSIAVPVFAAGAMRREHPRTARFLLIGALFGAIGIATMIIAGRIPYRVLLQGQPYRTLWILQVLEIPIAFWIAARLWQRDRGSRAAAVLLIGFFGLSGFFGLELGLSFVAICLSIVFYQRPGSATQRGDWLVPSLITGLAMGSLLAMLARVWLIAVRAPAVLLAFELRTFLGYLTNTPGPLVWFAFALAGIAFIVGSRASVRTIAAGAVALAVLTHSAAFALPRLPLYRQTQSPLERDIAFVRAYFDRQHPATGTPVTVYEGNWGNLNLVWFDLAADSYFHLAQLSGVMFSRETALEAQRRAEIVRRFALEWHHAVERFMTRWDRMIATNLWGPQLEETAPIEADLRRVCRADQGVDVAILHHDFNGLAAANNGRIYIYECARVRAAQR